MAGIIRNILYEKPSSLRVRRPNPFFSFHLSRTETLLRQRRVSSKLGMIPSNLCERCDCNTHCCRG